MAFETLCANHGHRIPEQAAILATARHGLATAALRSADGLLESHDDSKVDSKVDSRVDSKIDALIEFAVSADPAIRRQPAFRRFAVKRLLGRRLVRCVSSLVSRVRERRPTA
jgi:hypothetical protein